MPDWRDLLREDPVPWLLDAENPSVRWWTLTELLGRPDDDPEVRAARGDIMRTGVVPEILARQGVDGGWGDPRRFYLDKYRGTVWQVLILAEHAAASDDPRVRRAGELLLERSQDRESWGFSYEEAVKKGGGRPLQVIPCLTANLTWALVRLGFLSDPRLQGALSWLCRFHRCDDGETQPPDERPYDRFEMCWGRHTCHMGVVKTLKGLAAVPEEARSPEMKATIEDCAGFVLLHHVHKRSHDPTRDSKPSWRRFGFPLMYQTDVLEILDLLTRLGYRDPRMAEAVELVVSKQDARGRWKLESTFNGQFQVDVEVRGQPSRWITLRALRVLRRWGESG